MSYDNCGWNKPKSICWECANACNNRCSWSEALVPVEGWDAEPTVCNGGLESYLVKSCPQFVQDSPESRIRDIDTDGCLALIGKLLEMTHDDYVKGTDTAGKEIERFIRGRGASSLHQIQEPGKVIQKLRDERDEYRREKEEKKKKRLEEELAMKTEPAPEPDPEQFDQNWR